MKELFEVTIEVTQKCPNKCTYCSSWSGLDKLEMLDYDLICRIVDDAVELGAKLINVSGGEPLLHPSIVAILRYIKSKRLKIRLYSSGIYYDDGFCSLPFSLLESIKYEVDTLIFNYEADSPELYARIMGTVPEDLGVLDETIKRAISLGINVEAHIVPMKCNFRQIPYTIEKLYSIGVSNVSFLRLVCQGRSVENMDITLLSEDDELELKTMLTVLSDKYTGKIRLGKPYRMAKFSSCRTGTVRMAVRYDGYVFPCGAFKDGVMDINGVTPDNVRNKSLKDIYMTSEYFNKVRIMLSKYYESEVIEPCFGQYYRSNLK